MSLINRPPRPRMTGPIALYALGDVFGLSCFAIGASWFVSSKGALFANFPTSIAEAVACAAGGIVVMVWSAGHIMREIQKQGPELKMRYERYVRENYPEKAKSLANRTE